MELLQAKLFGLDPRQRVGEKAAESGVADAPVESLGEALKKNAHGGKSAESGVADAPVETLFEALKNNRSNDPLAGGSSSRGIAELTTRYLDLQGEVESAAIEAQELQQLADSGATSTREARQAQIRAATAKRKLAVVEKLLQGEIESTRAEIAWLEQAVASFEGGDQGERLKRRAQLTRVKANLDALESVRGGAPKEKPPAK
jgi:hypothetical protein